MNRWTTYALLIGVASASFAQQAGPAAPQDTEIVIPDMMLQIEELQIPQVRAVLPEEGELVLGRMSVLLPGAEELYIDEAVFTVPLPGSAQQFGAPSIFSSGRLGAGTANHILGELSLFRLGMSPRFRLRFSHEGIDGYQFIDAGTGYFSHTNIIDGWFTGGTDRLSSEFEAAFSEEVHGLQGQSDFYSVGLRRTVGNAQMRFVPDPVISLNVGLNGEYATRIQSVSGTGPVPSEQEFVINPAAEGRFGIRAVDLVVSTSYFLRFLAAGEIPVYQDMDLLAGLDIEFPVSLSASVRAGILWEPGAQLTYPWSIALDILLGEALETHIAGGYRVERLRLSDIWAAVPQAGIDADEGLSELTADGQWYGSVGARWSGLTGFAIAAGVDFVSHAAAADILPYNAETNRFPIVQLPMQSLTANTSVSWRPNPQVQIQAGWTGRFMDTTALRPTGSVSTAVRLADATERFSAGTEIRTDFFPAVTMPVVGLSGSFAPTDELEFSLEFSDVLAPFLDVGRPAIGPAVNADFPFIQPGFRASLFTRISL